MRTNRIFPAYLFALAFLLSPLASCSNAVVTPIARPTEQSTTTPIPPTLGAPTTERSLPPAVNVSEILPGIDPTFATQLKAEGIDKTISGQEGNWVVNKVITFNPDGTQTVENNVKVISFESATVNNPGFPDGIIKGMDGEGNTIFWSETEKAWINILQPSNNIESPIVIPYGKQYDIESALLNSDLNKPFSAEAERNFAGWSINFEYDELIKSSSAYLRPRDNQSMRWVVGNDGKPVWYSTTTKDGNTYEYTLVQFLLNDGKTMFVRSTLGEWSNEQRDAFEQAYLINGNFTSEYDARINISQKGYHFTKHSSDWLAYFDLSSLDSLLGQPGNNIGLLNNPLTPGFTFEYWLSQGFKRAKTEPSHQAEIYPNGDLFITSEFQKLLFALSFTVNQ